MGCWHEIYDKGTEQRLNVPTASKNASSSGVMGMMQNNINDAKAMEAETIRAEEGSQKACEDFVRG